MSFSGHYDFTSLVNYYLSQESRFSRSQLIQRICDDVSTFDHCSPYDPNLLFAVTDELNRQNDQLSLQKQVLQMIGSTEPNQNYSLFNQEQDTSVLNWQNQVMQNLQPIRTTQSVYEQGMLFYAAGQFDQAYDKFAEASEHGHLMARFNLGQMLLFGQGRDQNAELALHCLKECSDLKLCCAHFDVACCYYFGWGVQADVYQAEAYFLKAAACHDYRAHVCLAGIYLEEESAGLRDYPKAWDFGQFGVQNLEPVPQLSAWYLYGLYLLAMVLTEGYQNPIEALQYLQKGAELRDCGCQNALAYAKFHGYGCPIDKDAARYWWSQAVQSVQLPEACFHLAGMYLQGDSVEQDYAYARSLLQIAAASQRIPHAEYYLGIMYRDGHGGEQDLRRSQELLTSACQKGIQEACPVMMAG